MACPVDSYLKQQEEFWDDMAEARLYVIRNHAYHYQDVDMLVRFQHRLHRLLGPFYAGARRRGESHCPSALIHRMFAFNMMTAYHAVVALESNWTRQCVANIRNVIEAVPKMYYCKLCPDEAINVEAKDVIHGIEDRDEDKKRRMLEDWKSRGPICDIKDTSVDTMIERTKCKYGFGWFMDCLYDGKSKDAICRVRDDLSKVVHADTRNIHRPYNRNEIDVCFGHVKGMMFANIAAETEGHREADAVPEFPLKECRKFIGMMGQRLLKTNEIHILTPTAKLMAGRVES